MVLGGVKVVMKFSSGSQAFLRINVIKHDVIVFKKIRMKYVIKIMHIHILYLP